MIRDFKKRLRGIEKDFLTADLGQEQTVSYIVEPTGKELEKVQLLAPGINMLTYQGANIPALTN